MKDSRSLRGKAMLALLAAAGITTLAGCGKDTDIPCLYGPGPVSGDSTYQEATAPDMPGAPSTMPGAADNPAD